MSNLSKRIRLAKKYLKTMFLNSNDYEAILADESTLININKELKIYPEIVLDYLK